MIEDNQKLAHAIKIKFGTAPNNPTSYQLDRIKQDINTLLDKGLTLSERDWFEVVSRHCPETGKYFYRGKDLSDLITLLKLATKNDKDS